MILLPPGLLHGGLPSTPRSGPFCIHRRKLMKPAGPFVSYPQIAVVPSGSVAVTEMLLGVPAPGRIATVTDPIESALFRLVLATVSVYVTALPGLAVVGLILAV